jgi:peroxiredoxin
MSAERSRASLHSRPAIGDPAPDVAVFDASGRHVALSETWRRGPVVLTFLRHFG